MARWIRAMVLMTTVLAAAVPALAQVELATSGPGGTAFTWTGTRANAQAGAVLNRVDINGDVNRPDLLVGAPGSGSAGQGQAFIEIMGPPHSGAVSLSTTDVILTGEVAGDRFGAAISGGLIARSRDVIVGAPGALGGKGAVYLFPGRDYRSCGGRAGCGRPRERPARCRVCVRPLGRCAICDPAQSLRRRRHDLRSCVGASSGRGHLTRHYPARSPGRSCSAGARREHERRHRYRCTVAFEAGSRRSSTWPPVSIACCVPIPQALRSPPCWASK